MLQLFKKQSTCATKKNLLVEKCFVGAYNRTSYRTLRTTRENNKKNSLFCISKIFEGGVLLERPTIASRVSLFLLGHFQTNECEILDFCL